MGQRISVGKRGGSFDMIPLSKTRAKHIAKPNRAGWIAFMRLKFQCVQQTKYVCMRINEVIIRRVQEQATDGATSAGNIATVVSPHIAIGKDRFSKAYSGSPGKSGTRAPRLPKIVQPKNPDGTAKGAHNLKGTSLFGGPIA